LNKRTRSNTSSKKFKTAKSQGASQGSAHVGVCVTQDLPGAHIELIRDGDGAFEPREESALREGVYEIRWGNGKPTDIAIENGKVKNWLMSMDRAHGLLERATLRQAVRPRNGVRRLFSVASFGRFTSRNKIAGSRHPPLRSGPVSGCVVDRLPPSDRHRGRDGRGLTHCKEN